MLKYSHVVLGRLIIKNKQDNTDKIGKTGTNGIVNPRFKVGCVLRKMIMLTPTIPKVKRAPIFAKFASSFKSINPEINAPIIPTSQVERIGTPVFSFVLANASGSKPSRLIENKIRVAA